MNALPFLLVFTLPPSLPPFLPSFLPSSPPEDLLRPETKYRRKLYAMCPQEEDEEEGGKEGGRWGDVVREREGEKRGALTFRLAAPGISKT
jgi:hypothetical protein